MCKFPTVIWYEVFISNTSNLQKELFYQTGTTTLGQSGPGSNCSEVVIDILQISRIEASSLDSVSSHSQDTQTTV